jgi:glycine dehydrogenase subunit 1
LAEISGCRIALDGPRFKELVLETPIPGEDLVRRLGARGFLVGPGLGRWFEGMDNRIVIAVTERRTQEDVLALAEAIEKELAEG